MLSTEAGYAALSAWAEGFGALGRAGVKASGSFGVGLLARFLRVRGARGVEVNRPNRHHRCKFGQHDAAEAEATARALQANTATSEPKKSADGPEPHASAPPFSRSSPRVINPLINDCK